MAAAEEAARLEEERLRVEEEVRVTALRLHCDCTGHSHCRLTCLSLLPTLGRGLGYWGIGAHTHCTGLDGHGVADGVCLE